MNKTGMTPMGFVAVVAFCVLIVAALSACANWPKDSYIVGAKSTVNTPWGPSTLEAEMIATGKAASNASMPELTAAALEKAEKAKRAAAAAARAAAIAKATVEASQAEAATNAKK